MSATAPFFALAALSPTRQATFRRALAAHLLLLGGVTLAVLQQGAEAARPLFGHVLLTVGIVEGALLIGWRLTQLPRSQAMEFLLVSPLRPARFFLAEASVGMTFLAFVTLAGLPVLAMLAAVGVLDVFDLMPLTVMPFTWGCLTGLGLVAWAYQPKWFRRLGELFMLLLVLVYLVVGVLAGEKLLEWLQVLPDGFRLAFLRGFALADLHNPFSVLRFWLEQDIRHAWQRMFWLELAALGIIALLAWRAAVRLEGHFHERHYEPVRDVSHQRRAPVGDHPLAWWAIKRVSEYSGRINLYLAGGFCALYAAYLLAGESWPAWMGSRIFQMCDSVGGATALGVALVVLSAVPAAFQYGLWDSSTQDRCRRLELLLLTQLDPRDYWRAAAQAAWIRGRGYFLIAVTLWTTALLAGRQDLGTVLAGVAAGVLLWGLYFVLGFRAFVRGAQANGLGLLLTVGLPVSAWTLARLGWGWLGSLVPPGMVYRAGTAPDSLVWLVAPITVGCLTLYLARQTRSECDAQLRRWYDENHGNKVMH